MACCLGYNHGRASSSVSPALVLAVGHPSHSAEHPSCQHSAEDFSKAHKGRNSSCCSAGHILIRSTASGDTDGHWTLPGSVPTSTDNNATAAAVSPVQRDKATAAPPTPPAEPGRCSFVADAKLIVMGPNARDSHQPTGRTSGGSALAVLDAARASSGGRSSFANDRLMAANASQARRSMQLERDKAQAAPAAGSTLDVRSMPEPLHAAYQALGVVPPEMPVPLVMLERLWRLGSLAETQKRLEWFKEREIVRIAVLDDGSLWALVASDHLASIQAQFESLMPQFHRHLVEAYTQMGTTPLHLVPDDGYIMQNMAHHLILAGEVQQLWDVLSEPTWLEAKLHAYGIAAIVQDFRRYLAEIEDSDVKLLLQAFQLSLSCCMANPSVQMLREQMLARLMAIVRDIPSLKAAAEGTPKAAAPAGSSPGAGRNSSIHSAGSGRLQEWYENQSGRAAAEEALAAGYQLIHLMPRTATLEQAGGLHRMTLRGHSSPICRVVISPNGQDVITVAEDGSAQVWDMNIGDCVMQLTRDQALTDVAVAPSGQQAVVAAQDGNCCIWDLTNGQVSHVLKGHQAKVNAVAIDRQGIRCVTVAADGCVRVWSLSDGRCEQLLTGHASEGQAEVFGVAISADGTLAASVSEDFTCRVWDLDEEECLHVMEGHNGWVVSVAFVGTTMDVITASHDGTARLWDGWKGKCKATLEGHEGRLNKVVVDTGGSYAVTCSDDNTARVWDLDSMTCISVLKGHGAWINDAVISRDGQRVVTVSGDGLGLVWNVKTGAVEQQLEGHSDNVRSVALTYRGRFAITASDDCTARVWDIQAPNLKAVDRHEAKVKQLFAHPGGRRVVSSCDDGTAAVWDVATGRCVHRLEGHKSAVTHMALSLDGNATITGSADRRVCVWHTATGQVSHLLPDQQGSRVKGMAVDDKGSRAVMVLFDSTVAVWDLKTGACIAQLIKRGEREGVRNVHSGGVNTVLLSRDGRTAVTTSKDNTSRVWDVAGERVVHVLAGHEDSVVTAVLSADERLLASGSSDNTVRVWRLSDGACLAALQCPSSPTYLAFNRTSQLLAAVVEDGSTCMWDLSGEGLEAPLVLAGHKGEVHGALFSNDGYLLATWSADNSVRVWRTTTGEQVALFMADAAITSCCFAGDPHASDILVAGDASGSLHFLDFPTALHEEVRA